MEVRGKPPCWLVLSKWLVSLYVGPICDHVLGTSGSLCGTGKLCKQVSQTRLLGKSQIHRNVPRDWTEQRLRLILNLAGTWV